MDLKTANNGVSESRARRSAFVAALKQRCSRCREGRIFRGSVTMNESCPVCGLRFEREQGYFMGAMYFSYPLSVPILGLLILIGYLLLPNLRIEFTIGLATVAYLPFVPLVFRYSRVFWIYFERWANPNF
jgi:uncharacterized protein (DUF983 family)